MPWPWLLVAAMVTVGGANDVPNFPWLPPIEESAVGQERRHMFKRIKTEPLSDLVVVFFRGFLHVAVCLSVRSLFVLSPLLAFIFLYFSCWLCIWFFFVRLVLFNVHCFLARR